MIRIVALAFTVIGYFVLPAKEMLGMIALVIVYVAQIPTPTFFVLMEFVRIASKSVVNVQVPMIAAGR